MNPADIMDVITVTLGVTMFGGVAIAFYAFLDRGNDDHEQCIFFAQSSRKSEAEPERAVPITTDGREADDIGLAQRARAQEKGD